MASAVRSTEPRPVQPHRRRRESVRTGLRTALPPQEHRGAGEDDQRAPCPTVAAGRAAQGGEGAGGVFFVDAAADVGGDVALLAGPGGGASGGAGGGVALLDADVLGLVAQAGAADGAG